MKFCVTSSCPSSKLTQPRTSSLWMTTPRAIAPESSQSTNRANNIITEDWPARSLHLNVTEYAWDMLQRADNARQPAPNSLAELYVAVQQEWNNLGWYGWHAAFQTGTVRRFKPGEATPTTDTKDTTGCDSLSFRVIDEWFFSKFYKLCWAAPNRLWSVLLFCCCCCLFPNVCCT